MPLADVLFSGFFLKNGRGSSGDIDWGPKRMNIIAEKILETALKGVEKPGRYIGGEWNEIRKDPNKVEVKIGLVFPDVYEVGMSYLGQKILYELLNRYPTWLAERVFAPWPDFEQRLRHHGVPLFSLENKLALREFDILGFSLLYELNYSNILTILDLAGIPFYAQERRDPDPLILAGGPAAFNPEPLSELFDAFLLGDGEEAFPEIIKVFVNLKREKAGRDKILAELAKWSGVYVPAFYRPYEPKGSPLLARRPSAGVPPRILKRTVSSLCRVFSPERMVVPNIQAIFDRLAIEIARGCPQKCRFCQATSLYHPFRYRTPSQVVGKACRSLGSTGYEDVSLSALSVGDYPCLEETVEALMAELARAKISLSVSSLRPSGLSAGLAESIVRVRKTGFTLVPEAGTARLRQVINKNLSPEEILTAAENAFRRGWKLLKLYFMIGLPTEKEADLQGIVDLVGELVRLGKSILRTSPQLNVSLSSFIPKPHTPFQWLAMEEPELLIEKQSFIRSRLRRLRTVKLKEHPVESSILEAIFSRGDCRLADILIRAWQRGARFDGWKDRFDFSRWEAAFGERGLDYRIYLGALKPEVDLPWDHIDTGIKKAFLLREWKKAFRQEPTPSCLKSDCRRCRGCSQVLEQGKRPARAPTRGKFDWPSFGRATKEVGRYAVFYSKTGTARFLSHLDTVRHLQRALRRAGIRTAFSEGYHPKMLISYAPALPLGMEGKEECFEFKACFNFEEKAFVSRLNRNLARGLRILRVKRLDGQAPPLHQRIREVFFSLSLEEPEVIEAIERKKKEKGMASMDSFKFIEGILSSSTASIPSLLGFSVDRLRKKLFLRLEVSAARGWRAQDIIRDVLDVSQPVFAMAREKFGWIEEKDS